MCDQTEVLYSPNDVVWVKLGPVWWPGQVQDYDKLPEEITVNLRKRPLAVVKFFQEDTFEYVKNLNHIYHYNCRKKNEFIKKGMDMCRSTNSRDVPTNMKMFPTDIATAEHLTGGNPNILNSAMFAPEKKPDYTELFGSKKSPVKKIKSESGKKEYEGWRVKALKDPSLNSGRHSLPASTSGPRPITHPRFITKALEGRSDHEVRIRNQTTMQSIDDPDTPPLKQYNCHICGFTSTRLNVIVLHNKSHSAGFAQTSITPSSPKGKKPRLKDYSTSAPTDKFKTSTPKRFEGFESSRRRIFNDTNIRETGPNNSMETVNESPVKSATPKKTQIKKTADNTSKPSVKKPVFGKKKTAKEKAELAAKLRRENEAIRETLLKDWDEDDETQEEEELERLKQSVIETSSDAMFVDESSQEKKGGDSKDVQRSNNSKGSKSSKGSQKSGKGSEENTAPKEKSCFDFDDSEDALPLDETVMKFGRKIPRVISDEKPKKRSTDFMLDDLPPCASVEEGDRNSEPVKTETVKETLSDKDAADLHIAFKNLLEETSLPFIPDISKNLPAKHIKNNIFLQNQSSDSMSVDDTPEGTTENNINEDPQVSDHKNGQLLEQNSESKDENKQEHVKVDSVEECKTDINQPCMSSEPPDDVHMEKVESVIPESLDQPEKHNIQNINKSDQPVTSEPDQCKETEKTLHDMNLDINSMPVIIDEGMIEAGEQKTSATEVLSETMEQKYSTEPLIVTADSEIKQENEIKQESVASLSPVVTAPGNSQISVSEEASDDKAFVVKEDEGNTSGQSVVSISSSQDECGKPISNVKTTTVKTIKIQPNSASAKLQQIAGMQKGGQSQVLIVKTSSGQQSKLAVNKATLQKLGGAQHLLQQGGKVLILTNTQGGTTTQGKLATLSAQSQKVITSSGKLVTGARIITTKGTVLTSPGSQTVPGTNKSTTLSQTKTVITKSNANKVVVTKGNTVVGASKNIVNKAGILSSNQTVVTCKSPTTFITTQNILTSKGNIILPNTSQTATSSVKPATAVVASQAALSTTKGVILAPVTSKGTIVTSNQKLRLVTTKPTSTSVTPTVSGPLLISQSPQSKLILTSQQKPQQLKLVSNIKCQPGGNTILIQTSQGVLATSLPSNQQTANKQKIITKTVPAVVSQQSLSPQMTQQAAQSQINKKIAVQKVKPASPNILQKSQKKAVPRPANQKPVTNQLVSSVTQALHSPSSVVNPGRETILLSSSGNIPVLSQQSLIQSGIAHQAEGTALVYLTVDEAGNYRSLDESALVSFEGRPEPRTLYIESQPSEIDNIFLAIDNSGNVVNIAQPTAQTSLLADSSVPSHDILAKALANTQVLQPETIIPDHIEPSTSVLTNVYIEQPPHYPQPSLSNNVLETSLTLNQPIMTPLEVPSAISPSLSSNFIQSNLLASKSKPPLLRPSMPLLTDDTDTSPNQAEPVFLLDSSNNIISSATSAGPQLFQFALNDNNIIVTSSYEVVRNNLVPSHVNTLEPDSRGKKVIKYDLNDESIKFIKTSENQNNSVQDMEANNFVITRESIEIKSEKTSNFTDQVDNSDSQSQNIDTTSTVFTDGTSSENHGVNTANYAVVLENEVKQENITLESSATSTFSERSVLDSASLNSNSNKNSAMKHQSLKRPLDTSYSTIGSPGEEFDGVSKKLRIDER